MARFFVHQICNQARSCSSDIASSINDNSDSRKIVPSFTMTDTSSDRVALKTLSCKRVRQISTTDCGSIAHTCPLLPIKRYC
jgi:hypothetical protein